MNLVRLDGMPVVLDLDRLREELASEIRACCERLGARAIDWCSAGDEPLPASGAVLSALRWGERFIPQALLGPLEAQPRRPTLILLSAEPLVAPCVTLHDDLVVLVGEAATGRLYGELRLALLRAGSASGAAPVSGAPVDERSCPRFWCAGVAAALHHQGECLSALLPFEAGPVEIHVATLAGALRSGGDPSAELAARLGMRAGFVSLCADAGEWLIYWPSTTAPLWFCSPDRLPQVVEVRNLPRTGPAALRLRAGPGDAVFGLARPTPPGLAPPTPAEGGPAWLDRALAAGAVGPSAGAVAIEVRP